MKRILCLSAMIFLMGLSLISINSTKVRADEYGYTFSCGSDQYELSYITDDGKFKKDSCYVSFSDAKKAMNKKGEEYVVRHSKSYSPSKIIAMVSGNAYSYPGRSGTNTMNVYDSDKTGHNSLTYLTNHYEMRYEDTTLYLTSSAYAGQGMIKVAFDGFEGYADLEYTDLVPDKFIDNGLPIYLGGKDKTSEKEEPFYVKVLRSYYTVEKNGNYTELVFYNMRAYPTNKGQAGNPSVEERYVLGPAPSQMKVGQKYYSYDGHNYYSDYKCTKFVVDYYNYYQYLPLRSKTNLTASDLNGHLVKVKGSSTKSVIKNKGDAFISAQNNYGVNALLLYAMACHESAYGTSNYAMDRNNLFGWNAVDSDPNKATYFSSVDACINQHAGINLKGYLDYSDWRFYGSHLGNKGSGFNMKYASDPYWGAGIAQIAYEADKYANDYDGTLSDYKSYSLAIVDKNASFMDKASSSAKTFYKAEFGVSSYYTTYTVIALEKDGDYVKVQSTNPIIDSKVDTSNDMNKYDFNKSVAYVKSSNIHMINDAVLDSGNSSDTSGGSGSDTSGGNDSSSSAEAKQTMAISDMTLDENGNLKVAGSAFVSHRNYTDKDKIKHELTVYSLEDEKAIKTYALETLDSSGLSLNDGYDYKYVNFSGNIDLSDLPYGNYYMEITVTNGDSKDNIKVRTSNLKFHGQYQVSGDDSYLLNINQQYKSRVEISKTAPIFDYSNINKPSKLNSLTSINSLKIENRKLILDGIGYMLFTDFGIENNVSFKVYLVSNDGKKYEMGTNSGACELNYTDILSTGYDLSNICYSSSIDLSEVDSNTYHIAIEIRTDQYYDVVYLVDRQVHRYDPVTINDKTVQLDTSNDRDRVVLYVE